MVDPKDRPNGPAAAALLAGGIGCGVLGLLTFYNQVFPTTSLSKSLNWYNPVGTLAGKSSLAILAFLVSWILLGLLWRGREVNFRVIAIVSLVLLVIGLLGTFPPVWNLFIPNTPVS